MTDMQSAMQKTLIDIKDANVKIALHASLHAETEPAMTPFDESCIALMDRVAAFFGECASSPEFCGLSIDEVRDADNNLISLTLVPCDIVSGDPVRRVRR